MHTWAQFTIKRIIQINQILRKLNQIAFFIIWLLLLCLLSSDCLLSAPLSGIVYTAVVYKLATTLFVHATHVYLSVCIIVNKYKMATHSDITTHLRLFLFCQ